ncbi:MAG: hypothetical protein AB7K24_29095 [Gemmataceae bacterium]
MAAGLDRRGFVKLGATSGAALLSVACVRGEQEIARDRRAVAAIPACPPLDFNRFRSEMKKRNQPGVVVLLQPLTQGPAKQTNNKEAEKERLLKHLAEVSQPRNDLATAVHNSLFTCGDSELPLLLVQAVFVAAPAEQVRKEFPTLPTDAGLALIGVDGKVIRSLPIDADMGNKFAERAAQLLYGKDGDLLAERIKAERAALGAADCKKLDAAIIDLDNDDFNIRQQASQTLAGLFSKVQASLARAHKDAASMEVRARIDALYRKKLDGENTAALFQQSLAPHVAAAQFDIRVRCGQGALRPEAHRFVQLWTRHS